jgi:diguanylate cyclase (GGDEF)-like protein
MVDELTGIFNRRHFFILAEKEFERAMRYHRPLAVIMLDIDHFKLVNDTYGHQVGDQVLQSVAKICSRLIRKVDFLGRYGGEEFTILLPETKGQHAFNAAERLRKAVASSGVETPQGRVTVTVSVGVSTIEEGKGTSLESLLDLADRALFTAKQDGRNRVHLFHP